jgi:dTMP kinase
MDGSGKTSQVQAVTARLKAHGYEVLTTREPGGTRIGDKIREVLHDLAHTEMHTHTELLLYVASRAQLVHEVIRPRLAQGAVVISDRFADSTLAYQGYGHGLSLATLHNIINFATAGLQPDLSFFLDITPEEGIKRRQAAAAQGDEFNRLDAQSMAFHRRVYAGYQTLIAAEQGRWVVVDARQSQARVTQQILDTLAQHLPLLNNSH